MPGVPIYLHQAMVTLGSGGDPAALGGAVTVGLCGHWEHDGPCALPHHSSSEPVGDHTRLRTVFCADTADEPEVRRRIDAALAPGSKAGPDGATTCWTVLSSGPGQLRDEERMLGERLA